MHTVCVRPAVGLPSEPTSFICRLFQPSVLIESVRGCSADGGLQLLPRPGADGCRVLPCPTQGLIHRLVDGAKPLGLRAKARAHLRRISNSGPVHSSSQQMETQRSTFSMGEDASRVNVSSGVITFNPCLHIHPHTEAIFQHYSTENL